MNDDLQGEMNFKNSLLFFGIPGLLIFLGVYWLVPFLVSRGIPLISAYFLVIWGPIIILFIIILRRWLHSGKAGKKKTFKEYFNLRTLRGKAWLWVIAGLVAAQVLEVLLSPSSKILAPRRGEPICCASSFVSVFIRLRVKARPSLGAAVKIIKSFCRGVQGDGFLEKSPPGCRRQDIFMAGDVVDMNRKKYYILILEIK